MSEAKIVISAKDNASKVLADVRASMAESQRSAQILGTALGVVAGGFARIGIDSIASLAAIPKRIIDSIDAFNDLKDATGASIENISALDDIAARTGTSFETVQTALVKFNGVLKDAKTGSEAERAIQALGLSIKDLESLDPAEALLKTSKALAGFADDGNKARLTQVLYGRSTKDVAAFLKDLAEKGSLVAKVTSAQADEAEKLNKHLFVMAQNSRDAARSIISDYLPAINEVLAVYNSAGLSDALDTVGNKLFNWEGHQAQKTVLNIKSDLKDLQDQSDAITIDLFGKKSNLAKEIEAKTAELARAYDGYYKLTKGAAGGGRGVVNPEVVDPRVSLQILKDITTPKKAAKGPDVDADFKRYLENLQKQIEKTKDLSIYEQLLADIGEKRISLRGDQRAQLEEKAKLIDFLHAEADAQKELAEARKKSDVYFESLRKEQAAIEDSNAKLVEHIQEIGLTDTALNALRLHRLDDAIAMQEQSAAQLNLQNSSEEEIAQARRKIDLLKEQRNLTANAQVVQAGADTKAEQEKTAKDFADTLHNDLKGAFSTAFSDTTGEPLQAFGNAIANVIYSRAATAMAESLTQSLLSSIGGASSGSGSGSILASLLSFEGGGSTGSGARAGGLDGKGGFMAMLHPQESVLDHTKGQSAQPAVTVNYNMTVGDIASVSMVRQAVAGSERRIAACIGRSMGYGGALS